MLLDNFFSRRVEWKGRIAALVTGSLFLVELPFFVFAAENSSDATKADAQVAFLSGTSFETAFFYGAGYDLNFDDYLKGHGTAEGVYLLDIYLNGKKQIRSDIYFSYNPSSGMVEPCLNSDLLQQLDVDLVKIENDIPLLGGEGCLRINELISQATLHYDSGLLRLNLNIPQAFMKNLRSGYVDQKFWNEGQSLAFANYNFNTSRRKNNNIDSVKTFNSLGLSGGLNFGGWRFRGNSNLSQGTGIKSSFTTQNIYAKHDVTFLKSQFWVGDAYTQSQLFESIPFRGVQLVTDEEMYPDDERGYAPTIRGVAESNATVEIRQNGFLIYSMNVAPGPFEINNINPSGSNGNLEVTVIEADGRRRTAIEPFSNPSLMVRKGRLKYDAALGNYRKNLNDSYAPSFLESSALYGLTNGITIAGGFQSTNDYRSIATGVGLNTMAGAFSLELGHAQSHLPIGKLSGSNVRVMYQKYLEDLRTNLSFSIRNSLNEGYRSFSEYVVFRRNFNTVMSDYWVANRSGVRSQKSLQINRSLGEKGNPYGRFYLSASDFLYWDKGNSRNVSIGYNHVIGNSILNLNYINDKTKNSLGRGVRSNEFWVSLSIPLGGAGSSHVNTTFSKKNEGNAISAGANGRLPMWQDIRYSLRTGEDSYGLRSSSAFLSTVTPQGTLSGGYSNIHGISSYAQFQASGSMVLHGGGMNIGQSVAESFALVQIDPPVAGVNVAGRKHVVTGKNGYAIVPSVVPYRKNWLGLKVNDADIEINENMQSVVPRRGAAVLAKFQGISGHRVQFELKLPDGKPLPFGGVVKGNKGEHLGITDPYGRALVLLGVDQVQAELHVDLEDRQCSFPYSLPEKKPGENYQRMTLVCQNLDESVHSSASDRLQ